MNFRIFLLSLPIGLISLFANNNIAKAAYFNATADYSEADLNAEVGSGSFVEEFNTTSYVDANGMTVYELELNDAAPGTTLDLASSSQNEFLWDNGEEVDFELSFDDEVLQYQVGGEVVSTVNVEGAEFDLNGLILSARSTETSKAELTNLVFNDGSIATSDLISEGGEANFLKITGVNDSFTLTGTQTYSWTDAETENLDLAYQIQVGTFQEPSSDVFYSGNFSILGASIGLVAEEVPEPKTVSLFSLLLIGMVFKHRRRSN